MRSTTATWARPARILGIIAALAIAFVLARPVGSAIPASALVGRVTYTDINGTSDLTTSLRSFQLKFEMIEGQGRATLGVPRVVSEVGARSPWIMEAVVTQITLPSITVTLFHPSTQTRFQQWVFTDSTLTLDQQAQNGPASATPSEVVTWNYDAVRQSVYATNGTTLTATFCFDLDTLTEC